MQELLTSFQAYLLTEKRVARNTCSSYMSDLQQLHQFLVNHVLPTKIADITSDHLKQFLHYLHIQGITARSMARKICAVRSFFAYAHQQQGITDISQDLIAPKLEKKLPQFLQEEEISALLKVADEDTTPTGMRNKIMLYLLYTTGMRISELTHVKIQSIHADSGFIAVRGKGGNERLIPLPQPMMELLTHYLQRLPEAQKRQEYLFTTQYKKAVKPITRQAFWIILKKLWRKTGSTKNIWPHQLRHSLATHLLKNGADLRSLQLLLGHENISTVQVYTHVETTYVRTIYDKKHPRA